MRPPQPPSSPDATDLLPLIVEVAELLDIPRPRTSEPEPAFDPMAFAPGEEPVVVPPPSWLERIHLLGDRHGMGFACGAVLTAIALRLL